MIALAVAKALDAANLVTLDQAGTAGDCYIGWSPPQPDELVTILPQPGLPNRSATADESPELQVIVRGAPRDPVTPHDLAQAISDHLHGLDGTTLDAGGADEVQVIGITADQAGPTPLGADPAGRHEWSLRFTVHHHHPTTNRNR